MHLYFCLYKILFHFKAYCGSPSSFHCLSPPAKPTLLQYYCTTTAQYTPHHRPLRSMPYTIQYWRWQYHVKTNLYYHVSRSPGSLVFVSPVAGPGPVACCVQYVFQSFHIIYHLRNSLHLVILCGWRVFVFVFVCLMIDDDADGCDGCYL